MRQRILNIMEGGDWGGGSVSTGSVRLHGPRTQKEFTIHLCAESTRKECLTHTELVTL